MSAPAFHRVVLEGLEAGREEAALHGMTLEIVRHSGKHLIVEIRDDAGNHRRMPVSGSPRSGTNCDVIRQAVRRAVKSIQSRSNNNAS